MEKRLHQLSACQMGKITIVRITFWSNSAKNNMNKKVGLIQEDNESKLTKKQNDEYYSNRHGYDEASATEITSVTKKHKKIYKKRNSPWSSLKFGSRRYKWRSFEAQSCTSRCRTREQLESWFLHLMKEQPLNLEVHNAD